MKPLTESSDDDILDIFYRTQELMKKQYISKDIWHFYPLSHSTERSNI